MCNFIAIQVTRVPQLRDLVDDFHTEVLQKMMRLQAARGRESVARFIQDATGSAPSEEDVSKAMEWMEAGSFTIKLHPNQAVEAMLEGASAFVEPLSRMRWKVAEYDGPYLFTSDRPVSLWTAQPHPFFGVGVLTADEISIPISPTKAFVIYPQADVGTDLRPPRAGDINRRTLAGAYEWLFMDPGWMERTRRELEKTRATNDAGPRPS